jgi:D-lactate dehydrogenase
MSAPEIAFFDSKPYDEESFLKENAKYGYSLKFFKERLTSDSVPMAAGHGIVCVFVNDAVTGEVVERLHGMGVKQIVLRCAGYNNIDFKACFGKIHVARVPAYSPYAVAEHAVALMMTLNRKTHRAFSRVRENNFSIVGLLGFDMHGKTAGLVGAGNIGRILAGILKGFGMRVIISDPSAKPEQINEIGCELVSLDQLYAEADIISLHCPLMPSTKHMIDAGAIAKMKDGVMIINTSRGGLIDTAALVEGLKSQKVGYAGLDVYEEESDYFFQDKSDTVLTDDVLARLLSFNNVIVTSHQAFFTGEALTNIATTTMRNIADFLEGRPLVNEICYQCMKYGACPKTPGDAKRCF